MSSSTKSLSLWSDEKKQCEDLFDCFDRVHGIEEQCAICLENMKEGSGSILRVPCGHCFHRKCLSTWFFKKGERCTCPLCNFQPRPGDGEGIARVHL